MLCKPLWFKAAAAATAAMHMCKNMGCAAGQPHTTSLVRCVDGDVGAEEG